MREPAPDFFKIYTEPDICNKILPLLEEIVSREFRGVVMMNTDVDEDKRDLDDSADMIIAYLSGFVNALKEMYYQYGKKVSAMSWADSYEDFERARDALLEK